MKNFFVIVCLFPLFAFATRDTIAIRNAKPKIFKTGGRPRLQFGGQIGANLNYFVYKNGVQRDVSAGYQGGFFFRVSRQKAFVQFELNFLRSNVKLRNGIFSSQFGNNIPFSELKMKYHTVGIPFIFGAYAVKKPIYKLRFYNGIEAEFIAKTKATITQNNNEVYRLKRQEKRDIFRPAQFSYQLGMGMDIAMFIFDAKYSVGMRSFFKENYRTQTHLFQFTVGAIF